jgi:hypothetical protein
MCLAMMPGLMVGLWAQAASAGSPTIDTNPQVCSPGTFGWYGIPNEAKTQVPGNSGSKVTVYGYATTELYGTNTCSGTDYTTINFQNCYTYFEADLLQNGELLTYGTKTTNGGVHQLPVEFNNSSITDGYGASVATYLNTSWDPSCYDSSIAQTVNETTLVVA